MKALTISEPFASMIAIGDKIVENRTWPTKFRGRFAIHAGKGTQYIDKITLLNDYPDAGCVIALADLVECYAIEHIIDMASKSPGTRAGNSPYTWRDLAYHEHTEGPYCFVLANVDPLMWPDPAKGKQGFWEWERD